MRTLNRVDKSASALAEGGPRSVVSSALRAIRIKCASVQSMQRDPPPLTHGGNGDYLAAELDYDEMLALAGLFRQWAIGKNTFKPEQRTFLIGPVR